MALIREIETDRAPETPGEEELKNLNQLYKYVEICIPIPPVGKQSCLLTPPNP